MFCTLLLTIDPYITLNYACRSPDNGLKEADRVVEHFERKHIVWIPVLIIPSHVRLEGLPGFAAFRFGVGTASDSVIRGEDEKIGQRWFLFLSFPLQRVNNKTAIRGAQEAAKIFLPLMSVLASNLQLLSTNERLCVFQKVFERLAGGCCG